MHDHTCNVWCMHTHVMFGTCTHVRLVPFQKEWQACHQADILLLKLRLQLTQFAVFSMQLLLPLQDCSLPLCNLLLTAIRQKCVSYECAGSNPPIGHVILTGHKVPPSSSVKACLAAELQLLPRESSAACACKACTFDQKQFNSSCGSSNTSTGCSTSAYQIAFLFHGLILSQEQRQAFVLRPLTRVLDVRMFAFPCL